MDKEQRLRICMAEKGRSSHNEEGYRPDVSDRRKADKLLGEKIKDCGCVRRKKGGLHTGAGGGGGGGRLQTANAYDRIRADNSLWQRPKTVQRLWLCMTE